MSAFLVSERHINTIVAYGCTHAVPRGNMNRIDLTRMLTDANLRSLNARYSTTVAWTEDSATYTFKPVRRGAYSPTQIVKLCDCFDYQACEVEGYDATDAAKFVDRVRNAAIAKGGKQRRPLTTSVCGPITALDTQVNRYCSYISDQEGTKMYVIRRKLGLQTLHEMTKREYAEATRFDTVSTWTPVSAERAHRFVRYGGLHTTGLWMDQGRMRKATKGE
jgi:hypothetical protein